LRLKLVVPGYEDLRGDRGHGLALAECREAIEEILATETIYGFAKSQTEARQLSGRAPVFALSIPSCGDVVVRHSMRGGLLGKTGTDLFLPPTRALRELVNSFRLRAADVPTPQVVAYATYSAGGLFRRADVVTREIRHSSDIASLFAASPAPDVRSAAVEATARLIAGLTHAGAHHSDLNAKNILVARGDENATVAHVIDVDRVRFHLPGDPMITQANVARLIRSLRKWRDAGVELFTTDEEKIVATRSFELAT
jgi:hypothetical protein